MNATWWAHTGDLGANSLVTLERHGTSRSHRPGLWKVSLLRQGLDLIQIFEDERHPALPWRHCVQDDFGNLVVVP